MDCRKWKLAAALPTVTCRAVAGPVPTDAKDRRCPPTEPSAGRYCDTEVLLGANTKVLHTWQRDRPLGTFRGVRTDPFSGRVVAIEVRSKTLAGTIPPQLGQLGQLQVLDLSYNELTGTIPSTLGQLDQLQFLNLSFNRLTGAIPPELGQWPAARPTSRLGWPRPCAQDPLHGHRDRHFSQPSHPRFLHASMRQGQTQEGGSRSGHAQAAHRSERGEPGPGALANGILVNGDPYLTNNTDTVLFVKTWKVQIATPPVATKVSLGEPPHSGAGVACAGPAPPGWGEGGDWIGQEAQTGIPMPAQGQGQVVAPPSRHAL